MKDFPPHPDGPLGPWYRRVNDAVARAGACGDVAELVAVLGEPDTAAAADAVTTPSQHFAALGSRFRFGDGSIDRVLTWIDPYRPSRHYRFGVAGTRVVARWIDTFDDDTPPPAERP